ncbi:aspartate aminotransferase-like [Mytilus edulis]|uniref:aspartate aminotransferase-like n=1 Tax=Mytilus edulis TaxID=6550 RepID=UPI0039EFC2F7
MDDLVRPDLQNYSPASNLSLNEEIRKRLAAGETIYHFAFGQSPFPVIETAVEALKEYAGENAYLPVAGTLELRQSIAKFHKHFEDLDIDPDNIIVAPGSKELIFLLLQIFNGDVLIISPSWTTYHPQAKLSYHKPIIVNTTLDKEWKITPEDIEKVVRENEIHKNRIIIMNNPDNPSGTSYTREELKKLSDCFRLHNILVLSDEIYGRLHYHQDHTSILKYYPEGTILSTGLSKWASAGGWRVGYHVFPTELSSLKKAVRSAASHTYSCCPAPMQYAITKMFQDLDAIDSYTKHCSRIMMTVGNYCQRELTSVGVRCVVPKSGYYIFPDFEIMRPLLNKRGITTCEQMCKAMTAECSVVVMAGGPAFLRPVEELTTRLCYVPFDGKGALQASRKLGLEKPLPEKFVQEYCTPVYDGIQALKTWVMKHSEQHVNNIR